MFSRYNLPKKIEKCHNSLKYLKNKWNVGKENSYNLLQTYSPQIILATDKLLKITDAQVNNTIKQGTKLNNLRYLLKHKLQHIKNSNIKNKLLLSTAGFTVIETKGSLETTTPSQTSPPRAEVIFESAPPSPNVPIIPEPPAIPTNSVLESVADNAAIIGETDFSTLGLGGWSPVGIVQNCLEYLHVSLDLPWWAAIAIGTVCVRTLMFPLVIIAQRNGAKMNNYLPQLQILQLKMTEARQMGNQLDAARYGQEMVTFMKEKNLNPLKNMLVPLAQMPLFISFFIGLRQMANCPVQSMQYGGLFWFTDLTIPDQYFILPIITSLTMWATIEIGTDTAKLSAQNMQMMKYVLRAMPVIILPFTVNFPGAILCYWVCTNFISLGQVGFLRIPKVREYFKIEQLVTHNPDNLPIKSKGFVSGMKDSWTNMKISSEIEGRRQYDAMQFQRAGKGPIVKTYKFDPTKQTAATISTKKSR